MKIQPKPARPPALDPNDARYWDERDLEGEMKRVFEICHGCRMCVGFCGSFPDMFGRIDRDIEKKGADGSELTNLDDFRSVTDLCWQCKLCFIECPYTVDQKHEWAVDVPRLLMRFKANDAKRNGVTFQDKVLGEPGKLGAMASGFMAPVANLITSSQLLRKVQAKVTGISAEFPVPPFASTTFESWMNKRTPLEGAGTLGEVAIFSTCMGDYNFPSIAASAVRVLEKNGYSVTRPEQVCCGIPNLDGGDIDAAREKARTNVQSLLPHVRAGKLVVTVQPTCGYTIKKEWPELLGTAEGREVAAATVDIMELLERLRREKKLNREFKSGLGKVAYHAACHLRAQKIGFPGARILGLLPDTEVEIVEKCSAVDGTWGMKSQYYEMGRRYARKLASGIENAEAATVVTDCALSAQRILKENEVEALHPAEALARAYGIDPTESRRPSGKAARR